MRLSSYLRRFAFALRFGDFNTVISGQINSHTKLVFQRDIKDRVTKLAPFLKFDADPYPVILNGKTTWVLDGYTTTSRYPYSSSTSGDGGLGGNFNYVRNSVKATVDAYNGTVKFYVIDPKEPLIRSYRKAFPDLFTDFSKMPAGLRGTCATRRTSSRPRPPCSAGTTSPSRAVSTTATRSGWCRPTRARPAPTS